ncbi:MAG: hypothetical protein HY920_05640 [Elusimicrobia bacterium]|nr:hypothetical protein [Elusimicrobiota bacterium]
MFWKLYFLFIMIVAIKSYSLEEFRIWEIIDVDFFVLAMIAYFGFCWGKRIFTRSFWKIFFLLYLLWCVYYQYFIPMPEMPMNLSKALEEPQYIIATETLTFYIPVIVALYLYAFRRNKIWQGLE